MNKRITYSKEFKQEAVLSYPRFHGPPQRPAQAPHRRRLRHPGAGREPHAQAVRADAAHDEANEQRRHGQDAARPQGAFAILAGC